MTQPQPKPSTLPSEPGRRPCKGKKQKSSKPIIDDRSKMEENHALAINHRESSPQGEEKEKRNTSATPSPLLFSRSRSLLTGPLLNSNNHRQ